MEFFETMKSISIEHFICTNGDILEFIMDSKIVEDIIAKFFFHLNDNLDVLFSSYHELGCIVFVLATIWMLCP